MNISSILVHARPTEMPSVRSQLESLDGVEIHAVTEDGRFVVTLETETDGETTTIFDRINTMAGVLSAAMVYHQYESDPDHPIEVRTDCAVGSNQ